MSLVLIQLDCKELRVKRQENNDKKVLDALLKPGITRKQLEDVSNDKELNRVLHSLDFTYEQFIEKCREDRKFAILAAGRISINASRKRRRHHIANVQ